MKKLRDASLCLLVLVLLFTLAPGCNSGGGGGGAGPTAPPVPPPPPPPPPTLNLNGSWEGTWALQQGPLVALVSMSLEQEPNSRDVVGTLTSVGTTLPVRGTTNRSSDTTGSFDWEVFDAGCGTWTGHFVVDALDSMAGNSRLSTVGCVNPAIFTGVMSMMKVGSAAPAIESSTGTLGDLASGLTPRLP